MNTYQKMKAKIIVLSNEIDEALAVSKIGGPQVCFADGNFEKYQRQLSTAKAFSQISES